jgi:uncharacterized membrane protein YfhO
VKVIAVLHRELWPLTRLMNYKRKKIHFKTVVMVSIVVSLILEMASLYEIEKTQQSTGYHSHPRYSTISGPLESVVKKVSGF